MSSDLHVGTSAGTPSEGGADALADGRQRIRRRVWTRSPSAMAARRQGAWPATPTHGAIGSHDADAGRPTGHPARRPTIQGAVVLLERIPRVRLERSGGALAGPGRTID